MNKSSQVPTKEQIRDYMQRRIVEHQPPPSLDEIRRRLGWALITSKNSLFGLVEPCFATD